MFRTSRTFALEMRVAAEPHRERWTASLHHRPEQTALDVLQRRRAGQHLLGRHLLRRQPANTGFGFTCEGCDTLDASTGLLRDRRPRQLRERDPDHEGPAPSQPCTRRSACSAEPNSGFFTEPRQQRPPGRPGARLRLPARRQHRARCSGSSRPTVFNDNGAADSGFDGVGNGGDPDAHRRAMEELMLAFDVGPGAHRSGQQITDDGSVNAAVDALARIGTLLKNRANAAVHLGKFLGGAVTRVRPGREASASGSEERGYLFDRRELRLRDRCRRDRCVTWARPPCDALAVDAGSRS